MKLTQLEQSGVIIETNSGFRLAMDIGSLTPLDKLDGLNIDAMLVSHIHGDHFTPDHIEKIAPKKLYLNRECIEAMGEETLSSEIVEVKAGDTLDIGDTKVTFFEVDHGPNVGVKPKENFGFLIEVDGEKVYFGGDIFYPSGLDARALEVDRALIPVGGFYTFGPKEALEFVQMFKKVGKAMPMHYEKKPEMRDEFMQLAMAAGVAL